MTELASGSVVEGAIRQEDAKVTIKVISSARGHEPNSNDGIVLEKRGRSWRSPKGNTPDGSRSSAPLAIVPGSKVVEQCHHALIHQNALVSVIRIKLPSGPASLLYS